MIARTVPEDVEVKCEDILVWGDNGDVGVLDDPYSALDPARTGYPHHVKDNCDPSPEVMYTDGER